MKSFLIIGMGKFGHYICNNLLALGNDVMIVDIDELKVQDMIYKVTNVQIGDCTDEEVIKSLGISNFDMVLVCIGGNFQSSLEITWLCHKYHAKHVVSKANRDVHAQFLLREGADEIIFPDRDIAERLAKAYSADNIYDYISLDDGYSIYEISMPPEWVGRSLKDLNVRQKYEINVIGLKQGEKLNILPAVDYKFLPSDRLMIVGSEKTVEKFLHVKAEAIQEDQFWKKGRKQV